MDEKEYLKRLKENDYIAWDSTVNDPFVTGSDSGDGSGVFHLIIIIIVLCILYGSRSAEPTTKEPDCIESRCEDSQE